MVLKINLTKAQSTVGFQREAAYNALDTIATLEIDNILEARMSDGDRRVHDFYMALQGPSIAMTVRGIKINLLAKDQLLRELTLECNKVERQLANHREIKPIWDHMEKNTGACTKPSRKDGKHKWQPGVPDTAERKCLDCGASRLKVRPFKPSSDDDVQHLVYGLWKLKPVTNKNGKITADKEARERIAGRLKVKEQKYAEPIELLNRHADLHKQIGFLKFREDDGRFHSNFNVGVTSTHRWSSNQDAYGRGGNAQNITEKHRYAFEADDGMELCYADLKQAESKVISFVSGDEAYIEAHEGGDTHTFVCRLIWPEGVGGEEWTWDLKKDKKIAKSHTPVWDDKEGHDYRFQSKAVQHGSNLGLTPYGMAIQKRIPVAAATEGQLRYFKAFPGIKQYQGMIRELVQDQRPIVTPLGVRFQLFGRPWDEHTYKTGLAVIPQATVGHIISIGIWRIWIELPEIQLLAQVHDAILFQFPKGRYDLVHKAMQLMTIPIPIKDVNGVTRTMVIETEASVGQNWGHSSDTNPNGLHEIIFENENQWRIIDG
jgi:DNA polymerase I-like protein with 3'-5' exonuclease and polymerase domains